MAVTITSSNITNVSIQIDGRKWVSETHIDSLGISRIMTYLADANFDFNASLAAHATDLLLRLRNDEIDANIDSISSIGSLATPTFVYSTVAQNVAALRIAYQTATQFEAIMMGDFLNSLTDLQLQNAFGLIALQVTTLRANKLAPAATTATAIRTAAGQ